MAFGKSQQSTLSNAQAGTVLEELDAKDCCYKGAPSIWRGPESFPFPPGPTLMLSRETLAFFIHCPVPQTYASKHHLPSDFTHFKSMDQEESIPHRQQIAGCMAPTRSSKRPRYRHYTDWFPALDTSFIFVRKQQLHLACRLSFVIYRSYNLNKIISVIANCYITRGYRNTNHPSLNQEY
jgi:hypothetical protein